MVAELINIELNSDKKAKKAWKAGDNSNIKKAGYFLSLIFSVGFQIEEIRNLLPTVSLPKIRFKVAEVFEEVVEFDQEPTHTITTEEAEVIIFETYILSQELMILHMDFLRKHLLSSMIFL